MLESTHCEDIKLDRSNRRDPKIALLLSICPGLGQHYAGHLARGISAYIILITTSWLAAIGFMFVDSKISIILLATPFVGVALIAFDAYLCAKKQPEDYQIQWFNKEWIYGGVFLLLMVTINPLMDYLVGHKIVRAYMVNSPGMTPTLLLNDIVLVNKLATPKKGEIALINLRDSSAGNVRQFTNMDGANSVFNRIVAVEGDTVEVNSKGIFINGALLHDHESTDAAAHFTEEDALGPEKVPAGSLFSLADDRLYGIDSRILGYIKQEQIGGKVTKVFWSWNLDEGNFKWDRTALSLAGK
ncbi:MAG: signal peptidase I [Candidatus Polarisedimenticolaceae bacterium]|nr:signal peptidase I [Candidatus Polarisedimenticolaceae bacterium]